MATRKVKHARALEKRRLFFLTVSEGNQDWLKKAQNDRVEEHKKAERTAHERKVAKSKRLAKQNAKTLQTEGN